MRVGDTVVLPGGLLGEIEEIRPEGYEDVGGRYASEVVIVALDEGGFQGMPSCWVRPSHRSRGNWEIRDLSEEAW